MTENLFFAVNLNNNKYRTGGTFGNSISSFNLSNLIVIIVILNCSAPLQFPLNSEKEAYNYIFLIIISEEYKNSLIK